MVTWTRWLSHRYEPNSPIGRNLLAVVLPKRAAERYVSTRSVLAMSSGPEDEVATFIDAPEVGRAVRYGPNLVCGNSAMVNFRAGGFDTSVADA